MNFFDKNNRFNIANLVTYLNVSFGIIAIYFIVQGNFFVAIILAWLAGACDIIDGKLARKYKLSTEFGVQLDSFADFLSFVIMPPFLLFYALKEGMTSGWTELTVGIIFIGYIIAGLRRLIEFNLKVEEGEVAKYFEGVPTPLGAILLWVLYLLYSYAVITSIAVIVLLVIAVAWSMNSKLKIRHP